MASQLVIQDSHEGVAKRPEGSSEPAEDAEAVQAGEEDQPEQGMKIKEEGVLKGRAVSKGGLGK